MKTDKMEYRSDIMWRGYVLYALMLIVALVIIGKAYYIHFAEGDIWVAKGEEKSIRLREVEATRGNICAADGRLLATSVPFFDIRMDVASTNIPDEVFTSEVDGLATALSQLFRDRSPQQYKRLLISERARGNRYLLVKRNISYDQLKLVRGFPLWNRGQNAGGFIAVKKDKRVMPFAELARRTIGYQGGGAYVGLEGAYSQFLEGKSGQRLERRIATGIYIPVDDQNMVEPQNGKDVITTIDIDIQDVAQSALRQHLDSHNAEHGCAILMEVATGRIRAIANLTLDTSTGTYREDLNYAISEAIEPGSTFKLASMIAAMEDGYVDLDDPVNCLGGSITIAGATMSDAHRGGYGIITAQQVFEKSSNVGVIQITRAAYSSDPQKWVDRIHGMGLGKPLGLEIKGEGRPYIKNRKDPSWSALSLPWMSVGYELLLTPMQILTFYNAVANNGTMVKPQFVQEIREAGRTVESFEPQVLIERIASPGTIEKARVILEGVVLRGTARNLANASMTVAGKTGTAQSHSAEGYNKKDYRATFVGYFPTDKPVYSCIVMVTNPRGSAYYGGSVAAPVFKEIAEKVFSSEVGVRDVMSDSTLIAQASVNSLALTTHTIKVWEALSRRDLAKPMSELLWLQSDSSGWKAQEVNPVVNTIPELTGMGLRTAMAVVESRGLRVKAIGRGRVFQQSLPPGAALKEGELIIIWLQ
jgi:cell division protein FtsI (penicillin-binding protein 3)